MGVTVENGKKTKPIVGHSVIVGNGEVGSALAEVLSKRFHVFVKDVEAKDIPPEPAVLHICLNYHALSKDRWLGLVKDYIQNYRPRIVDVCSTVPPGTTESLGRNACHSTTRGLHPNLVEGILKIPKHIGGPAATLLARRYKAAGVKVVTHRKAVTTEVAHLCHLLDYGVQLMSADTRQDICRKFNVDYTEAVMRYTDTHNAGFSALDMPSKIRMNLTPPWGRVGGHCVSQAAELLMQSGIYHKLVEDLGRYGAIPESRG